MKIGVAQLNPTIGDVPGNTRLILEQIRLASAQGVRVLVFPELSVVGYPPQDLLDNRGLVDQAHSALIEIAGHCGDMVAVVGSVEPNPAPSGKPFFNSAAVLRRGLIESIYRKQLLPYYGVFDDERYFEPGTQPLLFEQDGLRFAVTICEDIWNRPGAVARSYSTDPIASLQTAGVNWLLNLSASPFHLGKNALRGELLSGIARSLNAGVVFCNQVGANDDLIFDGDSRVFGASGQELARAASFVPQLMVCDVEAKPAGDSPSVEKLSKEAQVAAALELGIRDYAVKTQSAGVCLGLSGGIDSSVVAVLAVRALGAHRVKGLLLPTRFTSAASVEDANSLAAALGMQVWDIPMDPLFELAQTQFATALGVKPQPLTQENLQPRLRMVLLMALANDQGLLLLNTSNKSEIAVGYATLYGDSAGALAVLGDLTKSQVYALARHLNCVQPCIPERVLTRPPTAELREGQKDEDALPPYPVLDPMVNSAVVGCGGPAEWEALGASKDQVHLFGQLYRGSEYKRRQLPPVLRVSSRAFGRGRRIPVVSSKPW